MKRNPGVTPLGLWLPVVGYAQLRGTVYWDADGNGLFFADFSGNVYGLKINAVK